MKSKDTRKASASIAKATVSLLEAVGLFFMANDKIYLSNRPSDGIFLSELTFLLYIDTFGE